MGTDHQQGFLVHHLKKMIGFWVQQDQLKASKKDKHNLRCPAPLYPDLEEDITSRRLMRGIQGKCFHQTDK